VIDWGHITNQLPGLAVGVLVGYGASLLQDWIVARFRRGGSEEGKARISFTGVAMFLITLLVAYASILSQRAANESKDSNDKITSGLTCLAVTTFQVNNALVERSTGSRNQIKANVKLQRAFSDFLAIFIQPEEVSPEVSGQALRKYYAALLKFINDANESLNAQVSNPYPVPEDLVDCLHDAGIDITLVPKNQITGNQNTDKPSKDAQ
jgi:hypothetical protein